MCVRVKTRKIIMSRLFEGGTVSAKLGAILFVLFTRIETLKRNEIVTLYVNACSSVCVFCRVDFI